MGRWVRQHGSASDYMRMYRYFEGLDSMNDAAYQKVNKMLDIRNYINFRVVQIFLNNSDSRGNIRYWNSQDLDGKFRMIFYDTDHSHGKYNRKYLEACLSNSRTAWYNPRWSTMYLTKLMEHPTFKSDFINQFAHLLNTVLHQDTINKAVDSFVSIYEDELPRDRRLLPRYFRNSAISKENWEDKVREIRKFAKLRSNHVRSEINRLLTGAGTYELIVEGDSGLVIINENRPIPLPFKGVYFKGVDLSVRIVQDVNWKFRHWSNGDTSALRFVSGKKGDVKLAPKINFIPNNNLLAVERTSAEELGIRAGDSKRNAVNENESNNVSGKSMDDYLSILAYILIGFGIILVIFYYTRRN